MSIRFTDATRKVVILAEEEARTLMHPHLGTEHFLLGLLRLEEGVVARALRSLDIDYEEVHPKIVQIVGVDEKATRGMRPLTARGLNILERARRVAHSRGSQDIEPEDILLGMLQEGQGVGARVLLDLSPDVQILREAVLALTDGMEG